MDVKQLRRAFKEASWLSKAEIQEFVVAAGRVPSAELAKLLSMLVDRGAAADNTRHRNRCFAYLKLAEQNTDPQLFVPYAKALRTGDQSVRTVMSVLLPRVNHVSAHGELCEVLGSPDETVREAAAKILGELAGAAAFKHLEKLVGQRDFAGRMEAMQVIVPKAGHRSIGMLRNVVRVGKLHERTRALQYLGDRELMARDVNEAAAVILEALADEDERVVCAGISTLGGVCEETAFLEYIEPFRHTSSLPVVRAIIDALKHYKSTTAIDYIGRRLRVGPNAIRMAALNSLEAIGTDEVVPILAEGLQHDQLQVRNRAAEALGNLATQQKVDLARTIVWLLRNRNVNVRRMAVDLAKRVGDPNGDLTPKLLRFLRDEDWWVRERVADALVEWAGHGLTRHVVDYLNDESDVVRRYAVGFLKRLKDPRSLGALVRTAQSDSDWWVREWALEAMAELGDARAVPYMLEIMQRDDEVRISALEALSTFSPPEAVPHVVPFLDHPDSETRLAAIKTLDAIGDMSVTELLTQRDDDEDHRVRKAAAALLEKWNKAQAGELLNAEKSQSLLDRMLVAVAQREADDLILAAGKTPFLKREGRTEVLTEQVFTPDQVRALLTPQLTTAQQEELAQLRDVDFSYEVKSVGLRFRAHVFMQRSGPSAVFRIIKNTILTLDQLGVPPIITEFSKFKNGLVLVGGPTGSGKSSTLAALINHINKTSSRHIVTLEDPIEVVHKRDQALINQREIGTHTNSFGDALRATLRQDPDVILVGEMRDYETISFAVTAAETGHLVFGTVHTVSADTSVDRLVNAFPPGQQPQVRSMLAETLRAVCCQHLLKRKGGGRALAMEIMLNNDAVSNLIRKGKTFQISSVVSTSREQGMQSMDVELARMVNEQIIEPTDGYAKANDKNAFENMTGQGEREGEAPPHARTGS